MSIQKPDAITLTATATGLTINIKDANRVSANVLQAAVMKHQMQLHQTQLKAYVVQIAERNRCTTEATALVAELNGWVQAGSAYSDVMFVNFGRDETAAQTLFGRLAAMNVVCTTGNLGNAPTGGTAGDPEDGKFYLANMRSGNGPDGSAVAGRGYLVRKGKLRSTIEYIQRNVIDTLVSTQQTEALAVTAAKDRLQQAFLSVSTWFRNAYQLLSGMFR
jgi:hypothetical protein